MVGKFFLSPAPMDAFSPYPPEWIKNASHALSFHCPSCAALPHDANRAWLNRYAPVTDALHRRRWQEFYECQCGTVWWAWSSDRAPSPYQTSDQRDNDEFRRGLY